MSIVRFGGGPQADPDDEKARTTDALCKEWRRRLDDPNFTSQLPPGAKQRLLADVSKLSFDLAVYRGELLKAQKRQMSPLGALGTTSTMTGGGVDPSAAITALIALTTLAIAVVVVAQNPGVFNMGRVLETSLGNLQTTSQDVLTAITPVPLDFSPNLPPQLLSRLIAEGIIVGTGVAMAMSIQKVRDHIERIFGAVNAINAIGQKRCAAQIAAVVALATSLGALLNRLEQIMKDGGDKGSILIQIIDLLKKLFDAEDAMEQCLATPGSSGLRAG